MIYDGHKCHLSLKVIKVAIDNGIAIIKLPSHSTHLLQPLDRCCFGPLKKLWDEQLTLHQQRQNFNSLSKAELVNILCEVWRIGLSEKNIVSGFSNTGIFPPNRSVYPDYLFDPKKLAAYNRETASDHPIVAEVPQEAACSSVQCCSHSLQEVSKFENYHSSLNRTIFAVLYYCSVFY